MKTDATNSRNPLLDELGSDASNGEAISGKKTAGASEDATGSEFREAAPNPASTRSGQHAGKCGVISRTDAERENEGSYWESIPAYASAGRRTLTPFERSEVLMAECGFTDDAPQ